MRKMKKVFRVLIFLLIIGAVIIIMDKNLGKNYIQADYINSLHLMYSYGNLIERKGEPLKELVGSIEGRSDISRPDLKVLLVYYEGVVIVYHYDEVNEQVGNIIYVQIDDAQYKLGPKNVCVGMSKARVKFLFRNARRSVDRTRIPDVFAFFDQDGNGIDVFVDEYYSNTYNYGIGLTYDDNNRIEYIFLFSEI
ncbi:MAG: hypothetical protein HDQ97_02855 [Lachnospiraceae bacterium]|nr:hypothetical protein [Lachnospiraceae bacterium]